MKKLLIIILAIVATINIDANINKKEKATTTKLQSNSKLKQFLRNKLLAPIKKIIEKSEKSKAELKNLITENSNKIQEWIAEKIGDIIYKQIIKRIKPVDIIHFLKEELFDR